MANRRSRKPSKKTATKRAAKPKAKPDAKYSLKLFLAEETAPGTVKTIEVPQFDIEKQLPANISMSMTKLQNLARDAGIPFGGLSKNRLVKKINKYISDKSSKGNDKIKIW